MGKRRREGKRGKEGKNGKREEREVKPQKAKDRTAATRSQKNPELGPVSPKASRGSIQGCSIHILSSDSHSPKVQENHQCSLL